MLLVAPEQVATGAELESDPLLDEQTGHRHGHPSKATGERDNLDGPEAPFSRMGVTDAVDAEGHLGAPGLSRVRGERGEQTKNHEDPHARIVSHTSTAAMAPARAPRCGRDRRCSEGPDVDQ